MQGQQTAVALRHDARMNVARVLALAVIAALGLVFVIPAAPAQASTPVAKASQAKNVAKFARSAMVGATYGTLCSGLSTKCFVCSGGVHLAWEQVRPGLVLRTSAKNQYNGTGLKINIGRGGKVDTKKLRPGDIIFWSTNGKQSHIYHNALYLGNGQILQTGSKRGKSWIGSVNDDSKNRMKFALRPGPQTGVPKTSGIQFTEVDGHIVISGFAQDPNKPKRAVRLRMWVYWRNAKGNEVQVAFHHDFFATQPTELDPGGFTRTHTYEKYGEYRFTIAAYDEESKRWFEIRSRTFTVTEPVVEEPVVEEPEVVPDDAEATADG